MGLVIDSLADIVRQSVDDAEVSQQDWEAALRQVFGSAERTATQCPRHGGPWGGDETCDDCVDDSGHVRPMPVIANRTLHLRITAVDEDDVEAKMLSIISALTDSDALPTGVTAITEPSISTLDPLERRTTAWDVAWSIDSEDESSATAAAVSIWRFIFGRGYSQPTNEEACLFVVTDKTTGESVEIDLSDERFASFFS